MADAYADAFPRLVPGARVVGQHWEAWPNDAVFRVVTIAVPEAMREDAARLVALKHDAYERLRVAGVPWSPYVVPDFHGGGHGS